MRTAFGRSVAAALLASAMLAASAGSAQGAASADTVTCAMTALSNGAPHKAMISDALDGSLLDVDGGNFTLGGQATCVVDDGSGGSPAVRAASIQLAGNWDSIVCGTGALVSNPASSLLDLSVGSDYVDLDLRIDFAKGDGKITIAGARNSSTGEQYTGDGYAHIQPRAPGNCMTTDVTSWDHAGTFVLKHLVP